MNMNSRRIIILAVACVTLGISLRSHAQINGPTSANINTTHTYSYTSSVVLGFANWYPNGGTVMNSWESLGGSGGTYYADIRWTGSGTLNLIFANYSETISTLQVNVCSAGQAVSVSISDPGTICHGANVSLTATPTNGGSSPSYVWKVNGVTKQSGSSSSYSTTTLVDDDVVAVTLTSSINCLASWTASRTISGLTPQPPTVTISPTNVFSDESVTFSASPGNGGSSPSYQWYRNNVAQGSGQSYSPGLLNALDEIFVRMTSNSTCYTGSLTDDSNIVMIRSDFYKQARHYVLVTQVNVDNLTDASQVEGLTAAERSSTVSYLGGLGNTIQTIALSSSPLGRDVVHTPKYDPLGRQLVQYVPYVSTVAHGKFRLHALDSNGYTNSHQYKFYQKTNLKIATDIKPYSTAEVEPSPLQRTTAYTGMGTAWYTATKKVTKEYLLNRASDNVRSWKVVSGLPVSTAAYANYELYVNITTDENGNKVKEYIDKLGRLIQKDVQSGATTWLKTSYVYDDFGRRAFVITPEGVRLMSGYTPTQAFIDNWAFQHRYDEFGRPIETKSPGAGWVYTVYDKLDRTAMSQTADQRTRNEWTFIKYDVYGRDAVIGYKVISGSRTTIQSNVDGQTYNYENTSADATGYTLNRTYPTTAVAADLLSVSYYDNYDFLGYTGWDAEAHSFAAVSELGAIAIAPLATGLPTGGKIRVVNSATPSSTWLNAVQYYDVSDRPVQMISENHLGGLDRSTFLYDFEGKVLETKRTHSPNNTTSLITQQRTGYDHTGRIRSVYHRIGEPVKWVNQVNVTVNGSTLTKGAGGTAWNAGAFSENSIGAGQDGWVEFTVDNINTYRTLGLSDQDGGANNTSIDFGFYAATEGRLFVTENGSEYGPLGTYTPADVFQVERKNGTIYYKKNGVAFYTSTIPSSGVLYADAALYNQGTSLINATIGRGSPNLQVVALEYNELGQLVDKKIHSTDAGTTFLQSMDQRYNIRGWLKSINNAQLNSDGGATNDDTNDYFGMEMLFNTTESGLVDTIFYNGNISAIKWKGPGGDSA